MMPPSPRRTKIFVCYSHKDKKYLEGLLPHLQYYGRNNHVDYWVDTSIKPGANWQKEIEIALASACVAILLISIDFLNSEFIIRDELPQLLAAAQAEGVVILPVVLRPCIVPRSLLPFQMVNSPANPLAKMKGYEREEIWVKVITALRENPDTSPSLNTIFEKELADVHISVSRDDLTLLQKPLLRDQESDSGDSPFSVVYLDHMQFDRAVVSSTEKFLGKPWGTFLLDSYSRRILAAYLTFDPPSYQACMMALRICVRRYARFPQTIVVDENKEFQSVYFDALLARYSCTKFVCSPTQLRFKSVIERLFHMITFQFVPTLPDPALSIKTATSKEQAVTLRDMYELLCQWAYEIYDQREHPSLGQSPRKVFLTGLLLDNKRERKHIPYDGDFLIMTLPGTPKGTAIVQPGKGIRLNGSFYWNEIFSAPEIEQMQVPVRYDPLDTGVIYVFVQNHWIQCI